MTKENKGGSCWQITFAAAETYPETLSNFIDEYFTTSALDYQDDGKEVLSAYADINFNEADFKQAAQNQGISLPPYQKTLLESSNWLKDYVIKFAPVEVADFLIYGIHEASCPKTEKIPVQVYAATAFGSEHQTTKMCLTAISELHQTIAKPNRILDMGTGSGILSIAAAKIWNKDVKILAADIDDEAVDVTNNNAITNNVEDCMKAILSDGYNNPEINKTAPYDIIFANILANPLKEMTLSAYQNLNQGGCYLISGFIDNQENDIIEHHKQVGFKVIKTYQMENWRAALLQK